MTALTLATAGAAHAGTPFSTHDVCGAAAAGHARCLAEVVTLSRNGRLVRPHIDPAPVSFRADETRAHLSAPAVDPPESGSPAYLQEAYDLGYLSATRGSGDTVAVVDAFGDPTAAADLATYRSESGLPPCATATGCFQQVNESGQPSPLPANSTSWSVEDSTDIDAVSALCPNCKIVLVEANSTSWYDFLAAMQTAANMGADQISNSWGVTAGSIPPGNVTFPGISVVAATGDAGYLTPAANTYPAASNGVIAAGGTSLSTDDSAPNPRGFSEAAWSGAGSGCDLQVAKPAYQTGIGCLGRAYADVSADADPNTGLSVYDSDDGGWLLAGGTSLASPLVAAFEAITGVDGTNPAWPYTDSADLNDPSTGSNGTCAAAILSICLAGLGYDGPTGAGSISGQVVTGAPGVGGPSIKSTGGPGYVAAVTTSTAALTGGVYPNGLDTHYFWQYGPTTAYGSQTPATDIGAGHAPVEVTGTLAGLTPATHYHYRLVAENSAGTSYGYDYDYTTLTAPPARPHQQVTSRRPRHAKPRRAKASRAKASRARASRAKSRHR